jgi:predicted nucleic acid-binding protein
MILVDTNVVVEVLRGTPAAHDWIKRTRADSGRLAASVLSVTEITGGMRSAERSAVTRLLGTLDLVGVDELTAHRAGELLREHRRSHQGIDIVDYLIAATAQVHGMELATLNVRHFPMFEGLQPPFAA